MFIPAIIDISDVELAVPAVSDEQRDTIDGKKEWYYRKILEQVTDENGS